MMSVMPPESAGWDIVSGVGVTALGAAGMRAMEGHHPEPLVRDPYGAAFVEAAADQLPGRIPVTPEEAAADPDFPWFGVGNYVAVRSRFFDDFFAAAAGAGLQQAVILAAGLDTRAFRLRWMPGTTVYEVDAPMVLAFKDAVLAGQGAVGHCDRRTVTADLRTDWPTAVREAGFNPSEPTAWLAEGLFPYLGDEAMASLLGHVHKLSAPGSRITADHMPACASCSSLPANWASAARGSGRGAEVHRAQAGETLKPGRPSGTYSMLATWFTCAQSGRGRDATGTAPSRRPPHESLGSAALS
jgi:methyltransferase (TIGR00027 family)